jgi:hypothetical protein
MLLSTRQPFAPQTVKIGALFPIDLHRSVGA